MNKDNNLKMGLILRLSISTFLFIIGGLIIGYPNISKSYIIVHYENFAQVFGISLLRSFIYNLSISSLYGVGIFIIIGGMGVILNIHVVIIIYAYIIAIVGICLHIPYKYNKIRKSRRLLTVIMVFFCMIIVFSTKKIGRGHNS